MSDAPAGVLGASGLVGERLLESLAASGRQAAAFSRNVPSDRAGQADWRSLSRTCLPSGERIADWLCACPIWAVPERFSLLEAHGARRVVAFSSTSVFTKSTSSEPSERRLADRLAEGEARVESWARSRGIEWMILRTTVIYGGGRDKAVAEIARFIRRFGFFPLLGPAQGLRQPVHAADVAATAVAALTLPRLGDRAYALSGAEVLPYRDMVVRIFAAMNRRPRLLTLPATAFDWAVALMRFWPRYRSWTPAMARRMNQDQAFDHSDARRDLGFSPRRFVLGADDVS